MYAQALQRKMLCMSRTIATVVLQLANTNAYACLPDDTVSLCRSNNLGRNDMKELKKIFMALKGLTLHISELMD
jgi:hypothetical protein